MGPTSIVGDNYLTMANLPNEFLVKILKHLPPQDLMRARELSTKFSDVVLRVNLPCQSVAFKIMNIYWKQSEAMVTDLFVRTFAQLQFPDETKKAMVDETIARLAKLTITSGADVLSKNCDLGELLEIYRFISSPGGTKLFTLIPALTKAGFETGAVIQEIMQKHLDPASRQLIGL